MHPVNVTPGLYGKAGFAKMTALPDKLTETPDWKIQWTF
jgi:hypothetical protein